MLVQNVKTDLYDIGQSLLLLVTQLALTECCITGSIANTSRAWLSETVRNSGPLNSAGTMNDKLKNGG